MTTRRFRTGYVTYLIAMQLCLSLAVAGAVFGVGPFHRLTTLVNPDCGDVRTVVAPEAGDAPVQRAPGKDSSGLCPGRRDGLAAVLLVSLALGLFRLASVGREEWVAARARA
jgi:hypothetical protein